jgi:hypothetical protein
MGRLAAFLLGSLCCVSDQASAGDIRCFHSADMAKPLRLEFGFPPEGSKTAYVRYENGSANIPLKLIRNESEETEPGRPMVFTTTWKEDLPGGGAYTVVSQGARVYEFTYVRAKDRKAFTFVEDIEAWTESGCRWRRP